ncbi:hypothetical protein K474DRAFT_1604982 [Panus rudis PR-1116 ss-1]|nr:hypothetical protein K474DRAFT_1604982 [Panus rudis PR-1116 ss-1]
MRGLQNVWRAHIAHNLNAEPQEIDVHRLGVQEAVFEIRRALKDAYVSGATSLKIIVGKGKHSKGKLSVLKPAVIRELEKYKIEANPEPNNAGVLLAILPGKVPDDVEGAGPSSVVS